MLVDHLFADELIDIDYDEHENIPKIGKFGHYLRVAFSSSDFSILFNAAKALGKPSLLYVVVLIVQDIWFEREQH